MNKSFLRIVACTLVSSIVSGDPAWAYVLDQTQPLPRFPNSRFLSQAVPARSVAGGQNPIWGGPEHREQRPFWKQPARPSETENPSQDADDVSRRNFLGWTAAAAAATAAEAVLNPVAVLAQQSKPAVTVSLSRPTSVSFQEARQHKNLLLRLADKSLRFKAVLVNIREKQDRADALAARDDIRVFMQNDLTHAPRIPLGSSKATPDPLRPAFSDVIAKVENEIHGPLKPEETLMPAASAHQKGFWSTFTYKLKRIGQALETGTKDGGWTFFSKPTVEKSLIDYTQALIDVQSARAEALQVLEEEWQGREMAAHGKKVFVAGLEQDWFDLALTEIEIRRTQSLIRYKEREIADQHIHIRKDFAPTSGAASSGGSSDASTAVPPAEKADLHTMEEDLRNLQTHLEKLGHDQKDQAAKVALNRLVDNDVTAEADADQYRALSPHIQPTLAFIRLVFLSKGQKFDDTQIQHFHEALSRVVEPDDRMNADPYSPESRSLVFKRAWPVDGLEAAIPAGDIARDDSHRLSLTTIRSWLDERNKDRLVLQVQPSPEQAILGFKIRHVLRFIAFLRLNFLREWTIRIFFKLGLDLPLQTSINLRQPVSLEQTNLLIKEQQDAIKHVEALLEYAKASNRASVIMARQALISAHDDLFKSAKDSVAILAELATEMDSQAARSAYRFEQSVFDIEKNTLELQKAAWRLYYLIDGRKTLSQLVDQKVDEFMNADPPAKPADVSPAPSAPAEDDKDLALPKTEKERKPAKRRVGVVGKAAFLAVAKAAAAWCATVSETPAQSFDVPSWLQWAFIVGLIHWAVWYPHYSNDLEEKDRINRVKKALAGIGLAITFFFPAGHLVGFLVAAATMTFAWIVRPEALTLLRLSGPSIVAYKISHGINRRVWLKLYGRIVIFGTVGLRILSPIGNALLWLFKTAYYRLAEDVPAASGIGVSTIQLPLSHEPLENAVLVRVKKPIGERHVLSARYLVRYIGPRDPIPDDAVFVFRSNVDPGSIKTQIIGAEAKLRTAEARLESLPSTNAPTAVVQEARSHIFAMRSELAALHAKQEAYFQPMPEGMPLEVDPAYDVIQEGALAKAGGPPLLLAILKPSRAVGLGMVLTSEQTASIGTALEAPERRIRMVLEPADGGTSYKIPVAAMPQLEKMTDSGSSLSTLLRDPAKGGFREFRLQGDIFLTKDFEKLPDGHDFTPPDTLRYLDDLGNGKPGTPQALGLVGFEEYAGSGQWKPFQEDIGDKVVALMELESTEAVQAQTTAPKESAAIDVTEIRQQLADAEKTLNNLLQQQSEFKNRRGRSKTAEARLKVEALIPEAQATVANYRAQLREAQASVQMKAAQGTLIGSRQTDVITPAGHWIFAKWPIARLLNPWTERFANAGMPSGRLPKSVMAWNPEALLQVGARPTIQITSALKRFATINQSAPWKVTFLGKNDDANLPKVFGSNVKDPTMDLSEVVLRQEVTQEKARLLFRHPASVVPVLVDLPSGSKILTEEQYQENHPLVSWSLLLEVVGGLAFIGTIYLAQATYRLRRRIPKPDARAADAVNDPYYEGTDYRPWYIDGGKPHPLPSMGLTELESLRNLLKTSYLPYEFQDEYGEPLKPWAVLYKRFKQPGLEKRHAKILVNHILFEETKGNVDRETTRQKWVWFFETLITFPVLYSDRVYQILHDAFLPGQPIWVSLQQIFKGVAISRFVDFFHFGTFFTHPIDFLENFGHLMPSFIGQVVPAIISGVVFLGLVYLLINALAQALARKVPTTWVWVRGAWYKRFRRIESIEKKFMRLSAEVSADGKEIPPKEAVQRVRQDMKAINAGGSDAKLGNPRPFVNMWIKFSDMLTDRASINLEDSAAAYLEEKPERLDVNISAAAYRFERPETLDQAFSSEARAVASEARTFAAALRETARNARTAQALIPVRAGPLKTDFDKEDLHFDPVVLEDLAVHRFGMDLPVIRQDVSERVRSRWKEELRSYVRELHAQDAAAMTDGSLDQEVEGRLVGAADEIQSEIDRRVERIHMEYSDRALVYWAMSEMRNRPILSLWTMETYDLTGIALRPLPPVEIPPLKENNEADVEAALRLADLYRKAEENFIRDAVEDVLKEFRVRLPTLSERSAWLRPKYTRQTDTLQMSHYLDKAFAEDIRDRLGPQRQERLLNHMLFRKSGTTEIPLLRERDEHDVPTFEALALRFYLRGPWPEKLAFEVQEALEKLLGYNTDRAREKVKEIEASLRLPSVRNFMATAVARRMRKDASKEFDDFLMELYDTASKSRGEYDLRFLAGPVAMQDKNKNNNATTADIVNADMRDSNFLEQLADYFKSPLLGNRDFFGDLALRADAREGAIDLGNETRWIQGDAHYVSMVEPLDRFAAILSGRMESRTPPWQSQKAHVFSSQQTDERLLHAGRRHPASILEVSVEPTNIHRALDPERTDESLFLLAPPNAHLKKSARVIFIDELWLDARALTEPLEDDESRIDEELRASERPADVGLGLFGEERPHRMTPESPEERYSRDEFARREEAVRRRAILAAEREEIRLLKDRRAKLQIYLNSETMAPATRKSLQEMYDGIYVQFNQMREKDPGMYQDYLARVMETRSFLERMNVRFRRALEWDPEILEEIPAEDSAKSNNTIELIYPHVREPFINPAKRVAVNDLGKTRVVLQDHLTRQSKNLLRDTFFGEGGKGAVYRVLRGVTFSKLSKGFLELRDEQNRLLAFRYYHRNDLEVNLLTGPVTLRAIYHSWTTVNKAVRGQGVAERFSTETLDYFRKMLGGKGVALCNIEDDNIPSVRNITKRGYIPVGEYNLGYSAQLFPNGFWSWLRRRGLPANFRRATMDDRHAIMQLLKNTYHGFQFTDFDIATFDPKDFYVWTERNQVVAVTHAEKQEWTFRKLKGWLPKIVGDHLHYLGPLLTLPFYRVFHSILPQVPGIEMVAGLVVIGIFFTFPLRWLFNLKNHRFLKLGDVAYLPGHAGTTKKLIQAAMAENKVHMAWGFFDRKGSAYQELRKAHAFGFTGFLNLLAETKLHTYAYPFDDESRRVVEALHEGLQQTKETYKPTFVPARHLSWLAPFAALGTLFYGLIHPASAAAATLIPSSSLHTAPVVQHAAQSAFQFVVQAGNSPWSIARQLLGAGARYTEIFGDQPTMLHPGDIFQVPGWTEPALPSAPLPKMIEIPLNRWENWLLHPTLPQELVWIAAIAAALGIVFWLWRTGRLQAWLKFVYVPFQRPVMALALATMAFAHSVAPNLLNPPNPPKPKSEITFVAGSIKEATDPEMRVVMASLPAIQETETSDPSPASGLASLARAAAVAPPNPLSAPQNPIPVTPKEKKAQSLVRYANKMTIKAREAFETGRSAPSISDEVKLLRLKYLAIYGRRAAEAASSKPLAPDLTPRPRGPRSFLHILNKVTSPVTKPLSKGVVKIFNRHTLPPEPLDLEIESLRAEIRELIRSVKRDQILIRSMLLWAREAPREDPAAIESLVMAVQQADARAEELRRALLENRPIENLPEAAQFEKVFDTSKLLLEVAPGTSQAPKDKADLAEEAAHGLVPVKGTEKMSRRQKQATLDEKRAAQHTASLQDMIRVRAAESEVAVKLALAAHLRALGMPSDAARIAVEALSLARQEGVLPRDIIEPLERAGQLRYLGQESDPVAAAQSARQGAPEDSQVLEFHGSQNFIDVADEAELKTRNPALHQILQPYLEGARQAHHDFGIIAHAAASRETAWIWKSAESAVAGYDPATLFPKDRSDVLDALQKEADIRIRLKIAEWTLPLAAEWESDLHLTVSAIEIPSLSDPIESPPLRLADAEAGTQPEGNSREDITAGGSSDGNAEPIAAVVAPATDLAGVIPTEPAGGAVVHHQTRKPQVAKVPVKNHDQRPPAMSPLPKPKPPAPPMARPTNSSTPNVTLNAARTNDGQSRLRWDYIAFFGGVFSLAVALYAFVRAKGGKTLFGILGPLWLAGHLMTDQARPIEHDRLWRSA